MHRYSILRGIYDVCICGILDIKHMQCSDNIEVHADNVMECRVLYTYETRGV